MIQDTINDKKLREEIARVLTDFSIKYRISPIELFALMQLSCLDLLNSVEHETIDLPVDEQLRRLREIEKHITR